MKLIEEIKYHLNFDNNDYGKHFRCPKCNLKLPIYIIFDETDSIKEIGINELEVIYNEPVPHLRKPPPAIPKIGVYPF